MASLQQIAAFGQANPQNPGGGLSIGQRAAEMRNRNRLAELARQDAQEQQEYARQRLQQQEQHDFARRATESMLSAPPEQRPQMYQGFLQEAQRRGYDISGDPTEYSDEFLHQMAGATGAQMPGSESVPSGLREFQGLAEAAGIAPGSDEYRRAAGIHLGLEGRGSSAGDQTFRMRGADGVERVFRFSPRSGDLSVYDGQGWVPASESDRRAVSGVSGGQQEAAQPRGEFLGRTPEDQEARTTEARKRTEMRVAKEASAPAVYRAVEYGIDEAQKFLSQARRLRDHPGLRYASGFGGEVLSRVSGTPAADAAAELDNLKNIAFITALSEMRASSPTGGAVGNVSDAEGKRFENAYVALTQSQSYEQFIENLDRLIDMTTGSVERIKNAYERDYADVPGAPRLSELGQRLQNEAPPVNDRGWQLMQDAAGNRAYVGPNGEIEEL